MSSTMRRFAVLAGIAAILAAGCGPMGELPDMPDDPVDGEMSPPYALATPDSKADDSYYTGIRAESRYFYSSVWRVYNQWEDTSTENAKKAGIAWEANSGLNWDQKYRLWVRSLRRVRAHAGYYDTFEITTPYGKTLPAPALECAETAMFLRVAFANWYQLPFFIAVSDSRGYASYLGHFGWRTRSGRYGGSPNFYTSYKDYRDLDWQTAGWPSDATLRGKALYGNQDDDQPFLGPDAHFGTYVDELFLNKRVGYFLFYLLGNAGSMHLASVKNTYNLKPSAISDGDVLVERWQRSGIGHTLVVKNVEPLAGGKLTVNLVSGSMPRRQPKWEESVVAKSYFTNQYTGGPNMSNDGVSYSRLGGGLKRWRVTKRINLYWRNAIMDSDRSGNWVSSSNYSAIEGRLTEFAMLLGDPDPDTLRDALLVGIEDRRQHLRRYPASCSARIRREELFRELYAVMQQYFGMSRTDVDRQYRKYEDYVLAELKYQESKTCCWNSTTAAMYQIIIDHARSLEDPNACQAPPVFKARSGDYEMYRQYAVSVGKGSQWVAWSEDESCPQRTVVNDAEADHDAAAYCTVFGGPVGCQEDQYAPNHSQGVAKSLGRGTHNSLQTCGGKEDWFKIAASGALSVTVRFQHADGDIDVELKDSSGNRVALSQGTSNSETVSSSGSGTYYLRVYGYSGAENAYSVEVSY